MDSDEGRKVQLVGHANFRRVNTLAEKFAVLGFHHLDFWCYDASNTYRRFAHGLGMQLVAKSDQTTGNTTFASYVLRSNNAVFAFTAPYSSKATGTSKTNPAPWYNQEGAKDFICKHGLGVKAVGIQVQDATKAYEAATAAGGIGVTPPHTLEHQGEVGGFACVAEVVLYGDAVLRFVSLHGYSGPFLPNYQPDSSLNESFGIQRLDHVVGNVHKLLETVEYIMNMTGFHEFAEFLAEDVGTVDSGLNR